MVPASIGTAILNSVFKTWSSTSLLILSVCIFHKELNFKKFACFSANNERFSDFCIVALHGAVDLVLRVCTQTPRILMILIMRLFIVFGYCKRLIICRVENRYLWNRNARIITNRHSVAFLRNIIF